MLFHARKSVAGTLAAIVLAATSQGCMRLVKKETWIPENEVSKSFPIGTAEQVRAVYDIASVEVTDQNLEVLVNRVKQREYLQQFQLTNEVQERKNIETHEEVNPKVSLSLLSMVGGMASAILGSNAEEEKNKFLGISLGIIFMGAGTIGLIANVYEDMESYKKRGDENETRTTNKNTRIVSQVIRKEPRSASKPAAGIEVIAESDFYAINGSGRTSVYTGADGRVSLLIGLPRGYVATEQELMQELMRRAEAGSMPLNEIRRYKTRAQVEHAIRLRTNAQPESSSSTAVDNAERSITLPVYKLPE